jgi:WD40 repeat protein
LRIFLSSPGDVSEERVLAERVFRRLNNEFAHAAALELILWEHEPLFAHSGFQQQIPRPSQCDLVVSVLWARLGTRLPADFAARPGELALTGTEFEIHDALDAYRRMGRPNLLIYRKTARPQVDLTSADAEERLAQYRRLQEFCQRAFYDAQGAAVVATHEFVQAHDFERKLYEHTRRWLERQLGTDLAARPRWTAGSPYRGLQAFHAEHRDIYFGRSQAISEVMSLLRETEMRGASGEEVTRWLLIQGMSGNGKSSLVRAGLLPLLEGGALEGIGLWYQVILKPSDRLDKRPEAGPVGALAALLTQAIPSIAQSYPDAAALAERLRAAPGQSAARLDGDLTREATRVGLKSAQIRLVVFVDQLEELFERSLTDADRSALIATLQALAREGRIWVIGTIRSDFISRIEEYPDLLALTAAGHLYILGPPQPDELADMIREPAQAAGLEWETQGAISLDQMVLREANENPESLPLLEYALDQLYERQQGGNLTFEAYKSLGGLKGAISQSAEAVLTAQESLAHAFPKLMRSLASVDENGVAVRRYAPLAELAEGSSERALLDALIARRLCVADSRGDEAVASFSHEALIQSWPRVTEWLRAEAGLLQTRELAQRDARLWQQHGESNAWLAPADKLLALRALESAEIALAPEVRRFIDRSHRQVRRTTRIKQAAVAAIALLAVAASIGAWIASTQKREAQIQAAAARESQLQLLTDAAAERLKDGDLIFARGILLEVLRRRLSASQAPDPAAIDVLQEIRASDPAMVIMTGHTDMVRKLAYSPDGTRIVTAGLDGTTRIWEPRTGVELRVLNVHPHIPGTPVYADIVKTAVYSPDGRRILTADAGGAIRTWDARNGTPLTRIVEDLKDLQSAAYSRDGSRIVSAAGPNAHVWDANTGAPGVVLKGPEDGLNTAVFSPDGTRVVGAAADGTARVWDAHTGRELLILRGHLGDVLSAVYSPDGARILTASRDSTARLWDARSGAQLIVISASSAQTQVWFAQFSPDGQTVATAGLDGTVRIWDAATGRQLKLFSGHLGLTTGVAYSPDGHYLASSSADQTARTWNLRDGADARVISGDVTSIDFSPDGTRILTTLSDGTRVRIWDALTGAPLASFFDPDGADGALYSPDGRTFLTTPHNKGIRIWDAASGARLLSIPSPTDDIDVMTAVYSLDGTRVLASFDDFSFATHDAKTGAMLGGVRNAHQDFITSAIYSPDATRILTASVDGTVRIWDAKTFALLRVLSQKEFINKAVYSPNGELIVAGTNDSFAHVWNARTGTELRVLAGHHAPVTRIAFSPDGSRIATGSMDRTIRIWDTPTGMPLAVLLGNHSRVTGVTYSPDGKRIASVDADHVAKIWDATVPADWRSQVVWEEALEADPLSDVQRTVLGIPSTLTLLTNRAIEAGAPIAKSSDAARSQEPAVWAGRAERLEREAVAASSGTMDDAKLLEAFALYARAAEHARREHWPESEWRRWCYRRASLARVLAADGLMQQVAQAYASVLDER